jgi:CRP-like cAMP-binding protein
MEGHRLVCTHIRAISRELYCRRTGKIQEIMTKTSYLSKLVDAANFASGIPEEEQRKLEQCIRPIELKRDTYFLREGEIPQRIGFNKSGLLRYFYIDRNGVELTKHFCLENTLAISYSAFLQRVESRFYIQALEDTKLLVVDYDTYHDLLDSHPCWQIAARKLAEMLFILKEKREAELLLDSAQERYQQFLVDYPGLEKRIPQYHIASYLGIVPESLSRIRSSLKE